MGSLEGDRGRVREVRHGRAADRVAVPRLEVARHARHLDDEARRGRDLVQVQREARHARTAGVLDLARAGVERVPRTVGVDHGYPRLEDGTVLEVDNVIWCTGFAPGLGWIDLPVFDDGRVAQHRGVVDSQPGLFFVGQKYLYAPSSSTLLGVDRDARYVVERIAERRRGTARVPALG